MRNHLLLVLALLNLGVPCWGIAQGVDSEHKLFNQIKARAEKGDAAAQLQLGFLYTTGTGVAPDLEKAFKWHRKAAQQGLPQAQYQLGLEFASGTGVKRDRSEAVHWFRAAAEKGFSPAQLELGMCYLEGQGIDANGSEALKWFRQASSLGSASADYQIGNCYLEGIGTAKDIEEGIRWVQQAADKGAATAQSALALAYERGTGVPKDNVQAYKWYALAGAQDDAHAADIRFSMAKLEAQLTKDQLAEAQRLAHEFKPGESRANPAPARPGTTNQSQPAAAIESVKTGFVTVKADDADSEVFVDGSFVGNSPAKVRLPEGPHVFEIKKTGFKDYRRELNVTIGSDLNLHAVLEKQ
ncbi:MAG TPA: PEGA domain-containing protein [Candidatus Limnocylindrales bacterium]|nr:PEGA domain-containing protein [Candidatus Limnocylindrales bacterium]